jgi:glycosyltransferase involved in cell wall biosynthesis
MHTVIVDGDVSYPPTSGKRLRTLNLMLRLARRHRLTYIARLASPSHSARDSQDARQYLSDHGIETILVHDPLPSKSGLAFYGRLAANLLLSNLPYSVASHQSRLMRHAVENYAAKHSVDLWQFEWLPYLETLRQPNCRRLVVAHNVDTLLWNRYYQAAGDPLRRLFLQRQWRRMEQFERTYFPQADSVVAVSEDDARIIRNDFGVPQVDVVENGIAREYFASADATRDVNRILFLGALDWRPNLDAVNVLLDRIFPQVIAHEPLARLCIVGRNPPPALVQRVRSLQGIELHADVPDVRPYLSQSGVMVVPLRIGGGSRLKILEALACGLPVVSTSVGAEGLNLEPGRHFAKADEPVSIAEALVQAIRLPLPFLEMARQGQQLVLEHYDWDALADKLEQVWLRVLNGQAEKRSAHGRFSSGACREAQECTSSN